MCCSSHVCFLLVCLPSAGHSKALSSVCCSHSCGWILSASEDQSVRIWAAGSREPTLIMVTLPKQDWPTACPWTSIVSCVTSSKSISFLFSSTALLFKKNVNGCQKSQTFLMGITRVPQKHGRDPVLSCCMLILESNVTFCVCLTSLTRPDMEAINIAPIRVFFFSSPAPV